MYPTAPSPRAFLLALTLLPVACSDEPAPAPEQQWCAAECAYLDRCGAPASADCESSCVEFLASRGNRDRGEVLTLAAECVDASDCALRTHGLYAVVCFGAAKRQVAPTPTTQRFCDSMSTVWFNCGYKADKAQCLLDWAGTADATLEQALACAVDSCEEMDQCLSDLFSYSSA